jgi:hypothetical protein
MVIISVMLAVRPGSVCADEAQPGQGVSPGGPVIDGPPPPLAPTTVSRDAAGRATVRAIRLDEPLQVDGRLDESVYQQMQPAGDFVQQVPREGAPATERTETWVMFDSRNIYVAARCWDTAPPERWIANELRRDTNQLRQNDTFGVIFDTFHDRRNGYLFYTNPLGARADQAVTDEGNLNVDWNPVWDVRTGRFDGGWTVEMAIPFKSLRYQSGTAQIWGINIRRVIRRRNEWTHLVPIPASAGVPGGIFRLSMAATLVGLDLPSAGSNVEIKPYGISRLTSDLARTPILSNHPEADVGIDAKYGVSANLTADVTVNTDFAQVEVDEQQVNLTRFTLQFPEKRDFFLEGRGIFDFGRTTNAPGSGNSSPVNGSPSLFYSRRIGLSGSRVVPIDVGGRLTGKAGKFTIGLMNLETGKESVSNTPATNFTVARVRRDILRRSTIGVMFTNRSESTVAPGHPNQAFGADAAFSFFQNVNASGYYARSVTDAHHQDNDSAQARLEYAADRYGAKIDYLKVGDNFTPEIGFVRRDNFQRTFGSLRFSPRPKNSTRVRKYTWEGTLEYLVNGSDRLESRQQGGRFATEFQTSDLFTVEVNRSYELLSRPFTVSPGVTIPIGSYPFSDVTTSYGFGQQRRVSGTVSLQRGHFYDGDLTAVGYSGGRVAILKQWSVEPSLSINHVELPAGTFTTTVIRTRTDYGFSPRMFASALVQYSSTDDLFSSNFRFRWEYRPGSEFFVVYTDERDTLARGYPDLKNRAFVVKINRLLRF